MVPASAASPQAWDGGPGMKSSLSSDFAGIEGQAAIDSDLAASFHQSLPGRANGNGSNTTHNIVGFQGVTITQADRQRLAT